MVFYSLPKTKQIDRSKLDLEREHRKTIILQVIAENHGGKSVAVIKKRLKDAGLIGGEINARRWFKYYSDPENE